MPFLIFFSESGTHYSTSSFSLLAKWTLSMESKCFPYAGNPFLIIFQVTQNAYYKKEISPYSYKNITPIKRDNSRLILNFHIPIFKTTKGNYIVSSLTEKITSFVNQQIHFFSSLLLLSSLTQTFLLALILFSLLIIIRSPILTRHEIGILKTLLATSLVSFFLYDLPSESNTSNTQSSQRLCIITDSEFSLYTQNNSISSLVSQVYQNGHFSILGYILIIELKVISGLLIPHANLHRQTTSKILLKRVITTPKQMNKCHPTGQTWKRVCMTDHQNVRSNHPCWQGKYWNNEPMPGWVTVHVCYQNHS